MIIFSIWDIILIVIISIVILISILSSIVIEIKKIGKKNCYECKYYKLYDVCSCGDGCRYKCNKKDRIDSVVSMNCTEHYEKCKIGAIREKTFEENRKIIMNIFGKTKDYINK